MASYRTFSLLNEYGQSYNLNTPSGGFFQSPEGLGFEMEYSYIRIGASWVANSFKPAQPMMEGEIAFMPPAPYDAFATFAQFCRRSKKLTLTYTTTAGTFKRDVDLISLEKSEIEAETGCLICNAKFAGKSLWYMAHENRIVINASNGLYLPFALPNRFNDQTYGDIQITNNGSEEAGFSMILNGSIVNPVIVLLQDGAEIARCEITTEAHTGEAIYYSSVDDDLYIYLKDANNNITNLFPMLDLANTNFFKFPIGSSSMHITSDSSITGNIQIIPKVVYKAV